MKKPPPKIRRGEVITAEFLNRLIRLEQALGWGSGSRTGGKLDSPGVQWFKAQEDFTAFEDVYRGDAKLWWYKPSSNAYAVHNDAITVYSHADDVATGDVFGAAFNVQSGRWEKVSGRAGTDIVLFEIDSFVYGLECEACNATVIMKGCNTTAGESIEVYDEAGCFFDVPEEILEGQRGFAVRMKDPSGYEGCKWVVMSLCCTEE